MNLGTITKDYLSAVYKVAVYLGDDAPAQFLEFHQLNRAISLTESRATRSIQELIRFGLIQLNPQGSHISITQEGINFLFSYDPFAQWHRSFKPAYFLEWKEYEKGPKALQELLSRRRPFLKIEVTKEKETGMEVKIIRDPIKYDQLSYLSKKDDRFDDVLKTDDQNRFGIISFSGARFYEIIDKIPDSHGVYSFLLQPIGSELSTNNGSTAETIPSTTTNIYYNFYQINMHIKKVEYSSHLEGTEEDFESIKTSLTELAPDQMQKIFDLFLQAEKATRPEHKQSLLGKITEFLLQWGIDINKDITSAAIYDALKWIAMRTFFGG